MSFELPGSYILKKYDELDSTNLEARRLAENHSGDKKIVVWAKSQKAGRGRNGRQWISEPGNLYFSILIPTQFKREVAPQLSFIASVAVRDSIGKMARTKWPNDILVKKKKVGGILLESAGKSGDFVIIGVGVNIDNFPDDTEFPASSLKHQDITESPDNLLNNIIMKFDEYYGKWLLDGFLAIRDEWLSSAEMLDSKIKVRTLKESLEGIFCGITDSGELLLKVAGGEKKLIPAGDVFFI